MDDLGDEVAAFGVVRSVCGDVDLESEYQRYASIDLGDDGGAGLEEGMDTI